MESPLDLHEPGAGDVPGVGLGMPAAHQPVTAPVDDERPGADPGERDEGEPLPSGPVGPLEPRPAAPAPHDPGEVAPEARTELVVAAASGVRSRRQEASYLSRSADGIPLPLTGRG